MAKYDNLEEHLGGLDRAREHRLSFADLEQILGCPLPPSARTYQAWWANQRGAGHSQAHSWMGAGWHSVDLDLKAKQVSFKPVSLPREPKLREALPAAPRPLTIDQAKAGIALGLGISPDKIDITIRARVRDHASSFRIRTAKGGQQS